MSVLKYKNDQGKWMGVPSLKGDPGAGVSDVTVTSDGHIKTTLSNGTVIDAGAIPQIITSVNGKTGAVTLTASDLNALTANDLDIISHVLTCGGTESADLQMFGPDGTSATFTVATRYEPYIFLSTRGSLSPGATLTATPTYEAGEYAAGGVSGMQLNTWYKLGHPMRGTRISLTKIKLTPSSGGLMDYSVLTVRYIPAAAP